MNDSPWKYVCEGCVNDPVIAEFIRQNCSEEDTCSYCDQREGVACCDFEEVCGFINDGILRLYTTDPYEEMGRDEGNWSGDTLYIEDVLQNLGFEPSSDELLEDVQEHLRGEQYAKRGYYCGTPSERAKEAWDNFCEVVKTKSRYTFWDDDDDDHMIEATPGKMMIWLLEKIQAAKLLTVIPVGTRFWRVRSDDHPERLINVDDFTTAPAPKSRTNRMSPAGIAMFYGAREFETAAQEIVDSNDPDLDSKTVVGMAFETVIPMNVLDLTAVPKPRSRFEPWPDEKWYEVKIFRALIADFSKPVTKEAEAHHIEYVPTQIFTEFMRRKLTHQGAPLHGIKYPSSKDRKECVVLFATKEECLPMSKVFGGTQWLASVDDSRKEVPASAVKDWKKKPPKKMPRRR